MAHSPLRRILICGATVACATAPFARAQPQTFDELLLAVETSSGSAAAQLVDEYLDQWGPPPLIEGSRAIVLARGERGRPRVSADFAVWWLDATAPQGRMAYLGDTGWYYWITDLRSDARVEYRIAWGDGAPEPDPLNPRRVRAYVGEKSEIRMAGFAEPAELHGPAPARTGRVEWHDFESAVLGDTRKVAVYLPPGYDESDADYPWALWGDGTAYVEWVNVPGITDRLIAAELMRPAVMILVDPVRRGLEYAGNPDYRRMIVEELLPQLSADYRLSSERLDRAVFGGSRGAAAAIDLAHAHPEVFGFCGAFAPAVSRTSLVESIGRDPRTKVRYFLSRSLYDRRFQGEAVTLLDALRFRGYFVTSVDIPQGHTPNAYRFVVGRMLESFFPVR